MNLTPNPRQPPPDQARAQAELLTMKRWATGLLAAVTILFVITTLLPNTWLVGFVKSFAEAAMVGALADWFAVTALFRHPLGIPIPHTAIIPRRKAAIGAAIGRFVQHNFLSEEVIAERLRSTDVALRVARWLSDPHQSRRLAENLADALRGVGQIVRDDDIQQLIEQGIVDRVGATQVAPLLGRLLGAITSDARRQELLRAMLEIAGQMIDENRGIIREAVRREMPRITLGLLDETVSSRIMSSLEETLRQVRENPDHPLRNQFNARLGELVERLQHDRDVIQWGEDVKQDTLQQPVVRELAASLWADIKAALTAPRSSADGVETPVQQALAGIGQALLRDEALRAKINQWGEQAARYVIREYGDEVSRLINDTVARWDARDTAHRLELQVGRDLQFIRINGTIVGGLAGLAIHIVEMLIT